MDSEHTLSLISDYVLGLLPAGERRRVESHTRQCATCRVALQRERQVETLARGAVHGAAQPAPGRLLALRPAIPAPRPRPTQLYRQLAPLTVIAVLLALGLLFGSGRPPFTPGLFATTATAASTATNAPTVTATAATPKATLASADTTATADTAARAAPVPLVKATPEP